GLGYDDPLPGAPDTTVGDALLTPTRIYAKAFEAMTALPGSPLHAAAHITGGGLIENPPRVLPEGMAMELTLGEVPVPPVLQAIAAQGVDTLEMRRTFNCGVGMLLVVQADAVADVVAALDTVGERSIPVGRIVARAPDGPPVVFMDT
ncbi:MAG: phosphoribosylformylglycinamidine cyclo-ligase, partial [Deltaproteobacteria bacterium]|nr:phosphoribosylformylglycinamidine cyclo-ligase [Deltaproteobacteria bacterium]